MQAMLVIEQALTYLCECGSDCDRFLGSGNQAVPRPLP